jgi:Coenzyme PQQ synthesis protein D (PqqD)
MTEQALNRPKKDEMVVINDDFDVPSLLHTAMGKIFVTNRVGARVMELADGSRTIDEIAEQLGAQFYGVEPGVLRSEVTAFLDDSAQRGLITWN